MFDHVFRWLGIDAEPSDSEPIDFPMGDDDEFTLADVDPPREVDPPAEIDAFEYIPAPSFNDEPPAEIIASYDRGELVPWRVDSSGRQWYRRAKR